MAVEDRQVVLKNLESGLKDKLTAGTLEEVLSLITEELGRYELVRKETDGGAEAEDFLEAFLQAKEISGCSPKTIIRYRYMITRFLKQAGVPVKNITVFHIRRDLMAMKTKGLSDNTIEGARAIYSSFFQWLHKEGLIGSNPAANVPSVKCAKKLRKPLTAVDLEKLKEACDSPRDKALMHFLLATGCRISEVCGLDRDSIDFQRLECVVHGKGNKERTVYIDRVTALLLTRYLEKRKDTLPALFVGRKSRRLSPDGVRVMLHRIGEKAGVENVHPHRFRRTLATNLINHGMALQEVAHILGHENVNTTMRYVFIEKENVRSAYRKYA